MKNSVFYTPDEKRKYYHEQLKSGVDKDGNPLTEKQRSYRAGFCKAVGAGVAAYKAKQKKNGN